MRHGILLKKLGITVICVAIVVVAAFLLIYMRKPPAELKVSAGQKVVVTVMADDVNDMYAYQFKMSYDADDFEYSGELESGIGEIQTIFAKELDGHQLIGATMLGEAPGVNGKNIKICHMSFMALRDCVISEESPSLSEVVVVSPELESEKDVSGWSLKASIE